MTTKSNKKAAGCSDVGGGCRRSLSGRRGWSLKGGGWSHRLSEGGASTKGMRVDGHSFTPGKTRQDFAGFPVKKWMCDGLFLKVYRV